MKCSNLRGEQYLLQHIELLLLCCTEKTGKTVVNTLPIKNQEESNKSLSTNYTPTKLLARERLASLIKHPDNRLVFLRTLIPTADLTGIMVPDF